MPFMNRICQALGFSKAYNFYLFIVFACAMLGFALARFMFIDVDRSFCGPGFSATNRASPGECYRYRYGLDRAGMILHLGCILPAGFLVFFQFVPAIRHRFLLAHRINGYAILVLSVAGTIGALIVTPHAFGGGLDAQSAFGSIAAMFLVALIMAYVSIRRLQVEQHRAWMLRAWFYAGAVISARPIMAVAAVVISKLGNYYVAIPCAVIGLLEAEQGHQGGIERAYPSCDSAGSSGGWAPVRAHFGGDDNSALGAAAALRAAFGMAGWLALALHAIGVEIYLHLTPAETERLRNVSFQKQLEAGMGHPGQSRLATDRLSVAE